MKYLYQPVSPFFINQEFGVNRACVNNVNKVITCDGDNPPYGFKSLYGPEGHLGLDLKAYHGQEVYCAQEGDVYKIDTNIRSGLDVRIESIVGGRMLRHIYEHLLGYQAKVGDRVLTGQLIGWADNTGYSSGDHVHFQVEELIDGEWRPIDPLPLMENRFAKTQLGINNTLKYLIEQVALLTDRVGSFLRQRSVKSNK